MGASNQEEKDRQAKGIDLDGISIRTDLAREAHDLALQNRSDGSGIPGVQMDEYEKDGIQVSWIQIADERGAQEVGKDPGTYLTLEVPGLKSHDSNLQKKVTSCFAEEFALFLQKIDIGPEDKVLIIGLGNRDVTADALGPFVVKHTLVTRHLFQLIPEQVEEGYRPVSAVSPGVLGTTGIETSEIVHGIIERSRPDVVIAIDALASRALSRVYTTIQVADNGINPGSGVGNKRKALNKETLGVPVIAIGVPTVVDAVTIAYDTIELVLCHLNREMTQTKPSNPLDPLNRPNLKELQAQDVQSTTRKRFMGMIGNLQPQEKRILIEEVLNPLGQNLIVTPKEVDAFIADMAKIIADGLNCALHKAVTMENVSAHAD